MNGDDKIKIVNALIEIKLALGNYNEVVESQLDSDQLKKAFDAVKEIASVVKEN